jgi:hypothetical protein
MVLDANTACSSIVSKLTRQAMQGFLKDPGAEQALLGSCILSRTSPVPASFPGDALVRLLFAVLGSQLTGR